jgi:hypothetical protein
MRVCSKCGVACHSWDPFTGGLCQYCVSQARTGDREDERRPVFPTVPEAPVLPPAALRYVAPAWVFPMRRQAIGARGLSLFLHSPGLIYCEDRTKAAA